MHVEAVQTDWPQCWAGAPSAPHPLPHKAHFGGNWNIPGGFEPDTGGETGPSPDKLLGGTEELELRASRRV